MNLNNPPKFYLLLITLVGVFALMTVGRIDADNAQAWGLIGSIVGYGIGNGIAARAGESVEPVFKRKAGDQGSIAWSILAGWAILLGGALAAALFIGYAVVLALR